MQFTQNCVDETNLIDLNWYVFVGIIVGIISLLFILVSYGPIRQWAIFPKWRTIRRIIKSVYRQSTVERNSI